MTIERVKHSGAWVIYSTVGGELITRTFYGYNKREAAALFRAEVTAMKKEIR